MRWFILVCMVAIAVVWLGEEPRPTGAERETAVVFAPAPAVSANRTAPDAPAGQRTRSLPGLAIEEAAGATAQQRFERELDPDAGAEEFMATSSPPAL